MENNNEPEIIDGAPKKFNKLGIISFIFCIVGVFVAGLPCGLVAMITGIIGTANFKSDTEKGRWMAITGLVVGVIEVIVMAIYIVAVGAAS